MEEVYWEDRDLHLLGNSGNTHAKYTHRVRIYFKRVKKVGPQKCRTQKKKRKKKRIKGPTQLSVASIESDQDLGGGKRGGGGMASTKQEFYSKKEKETSGRKTPKKKKDSLDCHREKPSTLSMSMQRRKTEKMQTPENRLSR